MRRSCALVDGEAQCVMRACLRKHAPTAEGEGLYTYKVVQDLVPNDAHHLKALLAANRVDDHVAVDADKVLGVEDAVLVLAGGVDHLDGEVVVAVADHFAEGVFDGRVVRVDKVAVDVLDCEGGFAWRVDVLEGLGLSREMCTAAGSGCSGEDRRVGRNVPTDLLPTMAILRCFC